MSWIRKIFNDDWTDKFDSEGEVSNVKLKINIFKTLQKKAKKTKWSIDTNISNLGIEATDQCRLKEIPANIFGPRRSEKADLQVRIYMAVV